jgi:hypothetical protein
MRDERGSQYLVEALAVGHAQAISGETLAP